MPPTKPVEIQLDDKSLAKLAAGQPITFVLMPARAIIRREDRLKQDASESGRLSIEVQRLLDAWNCSEYVLAHPNEGRNKPILDDNVKSHLPIIDRAIKSFGIESIIILIDEYFEACSRGEHLYNGRNRGYSHLGGFLRKLVTVKGNRRKLWWAGGHASIQDDHPKLTKQVANAYAKKFLGRSSYGLKNPSNEYREFASTADWIEIMAPKTSLKPTTLLRYLLDCVEQEAHARGRTVTPAWLNSELTWKNALPQYIKRILGDV